MQPLSLRFPEVGTYRQTSRKMELYQEYQTLSPDMGGPWGLPLVLLSSEEDLIDDIKHVSTLDIGVPSPEPLLNDDTLDVHSLGPSWMEEQTNLLQLLEDMPIPSQPVITIDTTALAELTKLEATSRAVLAALDSDSLADLTRLDVAGQDTPVLDVDSELDALYTSLLDQEPVVKPGYFGPSEMDGVDYMDVDSIVDSFRDGSPMSPLSAEEVESLLSSPPSSPAESSQSDETWSPNDQTLTRCSVVQSRPPRSEAADTPVLHKITDRKIRKKQQNKDAATRYRIKKREESNIRVGEEDELMNRNNDLKDQVDLMMHEIQAMKDILIDVYKAKGLNLEKALGKKLRYKK